MADTAKGEQDQVAVELSRDVVADVAPQELPLFPAVSRTFLQSRDRQVNRSGDRELAFGAAEAAHMLSPVILTVAAAAVRFIYDEVTRSLKDEAPDVIQSVVRALLGKASGAITAEQIDLARLSREQVGKLRQMVFDQATSLKLSAEQANILADSVAGKLVLANK